MIGDREGNVMYLKYKEARVQVPINQREREQNMNKRGIKGKKRKGTKYE